MINFLPFSFQISSVSWWHSLLMTLSHDDLLECLKMINLIIINIKPTTCYKLTQFSYGLHKLGINQSYSWVSDLFCITFGGIVLLSCGYWPFTSFNSFFSLKHNIPWNIPTNPRFYTLALLSEYCVSLFRNSQTNTLV